VISSATARAHTGVLILASSGVIQVPQYHSIFLSPFPRHIITQHVHLPSDLLFTRTPHFIPCTNPIFQPRSMNHDARHPSISPAVITKPSFPNSSIELQSHSLTRRPSSPEKMFQFTNSSAIMIIHHPTGL